MSYFGLIYVKNKNDEIEEENIKKCTKCPKFLIKNVQK